MNKEFGLSEPRTKEQLGKQLKEIVEVIIHEYEENSSCDGISIKVLGDSIGDLIVVTNELLENEEDYLELKWINGEWYD